MAGGAGGVGGVDLIDDESDTVILSPPLKALEQGAVASQEDLAQILNVSVRTIKRDFEELQGQGLYLPSRGNLHGIGRGQTHKAQIIALYEQGCDETEIARQSQHAPNLRTQLYSH